MFSEDVHVDPTLRSVWVAYPMKDRHDWETIIKPRLDPKSPGRFPMGEDLEQYARSVGDRDYPLSIQCDWAFYWEDMAGKAGPLCSPATYRRFVLPRLKHLAELLHAHGIRHIIVDSDGNSDVLIPLWLEVGVNGLRPFEVAAGCDPLAIRRKYGANLVIQGGIDKRALALGREAIEREVLSKVPWLCLQGGYFPQVDHLVPPDVSLENYCYYAQLLRAVVEDPERYLYQARKRGFFEETA